VALVGNMQENTSVVQWIVGSTVSEYDYYQDDDAHLVVFVFPRSVLYVALLTADMESRF